MPILLSPPRSRRTFVSHLAVTLAAVALAASAARAGAGAGAAGAASTTAAAPAAERPLYYQRPIIEADVAGRTLRELAIMRNTIFARAGQPFRKQWLHDYFSTLPWYQVKGIVDPKSLSPIDQQNADFLSRYEIALPRPDLERRLHAIQDRHRYAIDDEPRAIAFTPDGKRALLGGAGAIRLVDLPSGRPSAIWAVRSEAIGLVPEKLRGVELSTARELETIALIVGGTGKVVSHAKVDPPFKRKGVFSADGRRLLGGPAYADVDTSDGSTEEELTDGSVVAVDVATGKVLLRHKVEDGTPCLTLTPDGERALVTDLGAVSLWDLAKAKALWTHARAKGAADAAGCTAAAISPDGALAVIAAPAGGLVFELKSGQVVRRLALPPARVLAFSASGAELLVGGGEESNGREAAGGKPALEIWDITRGQRIRWLPAAGAIAAVAWSGDGARVLSNGSRGPALWDAASGRALAAFDGYETWWSRDEQIEAVLLSRALGRPLAAFGQLDFERTPFDAPELLDELVPLAQLKNMSRRDLRLLRNMVYARRGRHFRSPILRDYFDRLDWYRADPAYTDARLTAIDRRNIKLIQSTEIELGGPINDRQHQEEDVPEA